VQPKRRRREPVVAARTGRHPKWPTRVAVRPGDRVLELFVKSPRGQLRNVIHRNWCKHLFCRNTPCAKGIDDVDRGLGPRPVGDHSVELIVGEAPLFRRCESCIAEQVGSPHCLDHVRPVGVIAHARRHPYIVRGGWVDALHVTAFVTRARQIVEPEKYFDADEVSLLLTKDAAVLLRECSEFLAPYLAAAKLNGEVRKDLDVAGAGEWFARMLFSLLSTPSSTLDMDDDEIVADFVRSHVVRGFANDRAGRSR
jgi:hypothetical protein